MLDLEELEPPDLSEAGLPELDDFWDHDPAVRCLVAEVAQTPVPQGLGTLGWAPDEDVNAALVASEREARAAQARGLRLVVVLMDRLTAGGWAAPGGVGLSWGEAGVSEFAADEIATLLGVSRRVAELRMDDAFTLVHRLPGVLAALEAGLVSLPVARILATETAETDSATAAEVGRCVLDALGRGVVHHVGRLSGLELLAWATACPGAAAEVAARATGPRVRVLARRALTVLDSDALREAREKALDRRDVQIWRSRPGMAWVGADLPEARAGAVYDRINARALDQHRRPGEDRTVAQIRADLFCDWLLGVGAAGEPGPPLSVHVTVDGSGVTELGRLGPVSPETVLDLLGMAQATTGEVRVTSVVAPPCSGDHQDGAGPYRPSRRLAAAVMRRDRTCRFPGCSTPARSCDLDHTVPHPDGPTCICNLACLCRHHHRLKTLGLWTLTNHGDGHLTWTSPHGRTYDVWPDGP